MKKLLKPITKEIEKLDPKRDVLAVSSQDLGRNTYKNCTLYIDSESKKIVGIHKIKIPSKFNEVDITTFVSKTTPIFKITRFFNSIRTINYYLIGDNAVNTIIPGVKNVNNLEGEKHVLENIDTFICYSWVDCKHALKNKLDNFNIIPLFSIALTRDMESQGISEMQREKIAKTSYHIELYPEGLGKPDLVVETKIPTQNIKYIQYNVQGSCCIYAHLNPNDLNNDYASEIKGAGTFVESSDYTCSKVITEYIENKYNDDFISLDISSKEMTLNLHHKNNTSFKMSRTILFGTYDIYKGVIDKLKKINPEVTYNLDEITKLHIKNETIKTANYLPFVKSQEFENEYTIAELFEEVFNIQKEILWKKIHTEYYNLLGEHKNIRPKFICLGGGGMLANGNLQTPFMEIVFKLIQEINVNYRLGTTEPAKFYELIMPHGLYPQLDYKFTNTDKCLGAHAFGICKQIHLGMSGKLSR